MARHADLGANICKGCPRILLDSEECFLLRPQQPVQTTGNEQVRRGGSEPRGVDATAPWGSRLVISDFD
jgi:hypothetical protein